VEKLVSKFVFFQMQLVPLQRGCPPRAPLGRESLSAFIYRKLTPRQPPGRVGTFRVIQSRTRVMGWHFHVILQSKDKLMTASGVHVANLTPGSECNPTSGVCVAGRRVPQPPPRGPADRGGGARLAGGVGERGLNGLKD
jgi:hypothetical protein